MRQLSSHSGKQGPSFALIAAHSERCAIGSTSYYTQAECSPYGFPTETDDPEFHVHILHDCNWALNRCRCRFAQYIKDIKGIFVARQRASMLRRDPAFRQWATSAIEYTAVSRQRRLLYLHLRLQGYDGGWTIRRSIAFSEVFRIGSSVNREGPLEAEDDEAMHRDLEPGDGRRPGSPGEQSHQERDGESPVRDTREKSEKISAVITRLIYKYLPVPLTNFINIRAITMDDRYNWINNDTKVFKNVVASISRKLQNMRLAELIEMIEIAEPYFMGVDHGHYGDVREAGRYLKRLLLFQFNEDEERIHEFLQTTVYILDRERPKLNTLMLWGPPCSGKTWYILACASLCLSMGTMRNLNKQSGSFPTQDCYNKRVILWEEPNYSGEFIEYLKNLLGGFPANTAIKHADDVAINRTPVLITSNPNRFNDSDAWHSRIAKYHWTPANFMAEITKPLHPQALINVFREYQVIE